VLTIWFHDADWKFGCGVWLPLKLRGRLVLNVAKVAANEIVKYFRDTMLITS
jgi:hypothetical protein